MTNIKNNRVPLLPMSFRKRKRRCVKHEVSSLVRLSGPARIGWTAASYLTMIGSDTMIEHLPQQYFSAVLITAIAVAFLFLVVMYLCRYEDWKADTLALYIDKLNTLGAPAMDDRPDTAFSKVYIASLGVSLILSTAASVFISPIVVDFVASTPCLTSYVVVTSVVAVVLAIFLDGELAHAIADKSFRSKYNKIQETVVSELEGVFLKDREAAAPQAVMTDEALAKLAELLKSKL